MRALLIAAIGATLLGCGPDLDENEPAQSAQQALGAAPLDVPPAFGEHPTLKDPKDLFGLSPAADPFRPTFQQHFAYTTPLPH